MANEYIFNINTQACVVLVNKLEQLHKSAFPLAVRGTLNAAAFDVKMRTLDESATQNFIRRSPTFFKRFSGVNRATGWSIDRMRAEVGMTAEGGGATELSARTAVANMEKQEEGGKITEGLEYLKASRVGGSADRLVSRSKRWNRANVIASGVSYSVKTHKVFGTTKSRIVADAYSALKLKMVQKIKLNGRNAYRQITSITKTAKGKIKINSKILYIARNGNNKPISATHFSREAAQRTIPHIPMYFNVEAQKQIDRLWK